MEKNDLMFISPPPPHLGFPSLDALIAWYAAHPERIAILKNVRLPDSID